MALPIYIQDPSTGQRMAVSSDGALLVNIVEGAAAELPVDTLTRRKLLRGFLDNGGSIDMNVNGSGTPVEFTEVADTTRTKWITSVRVLFNGANLEMNSNDFRRFGEATASQTPLTNGVELFVVQGGGQTNFFVTPITRMGDFFSYADSYLNIINAVSSQSDFLYFDFDFEQPVVIPPGTTDRIVLRVSDDLTSIDLFNCIVRGYQEIIE
jgi:hypothetical protein